MEVVKGRCEYRPHRARLAASLHPLQYGGLVMFALVPLDVRPRSPLRGIPWANYLLVGLNVLFYLFFITLGWQWTCGRGTGFGSILLYGFSHAGFWHLAANLWALLVFGNAVNLRIGNVYYLLAYLGAIVAIGFVAWILLPGQVIGASGGVFAVIGIAILLLPAAQLRVGYIAVFPVTLLVALFQRPEQPWQLGIRWGDFPIPMVWCLMFIPLLEVWGLVWSGGSWTHMGHLLGLLVGIAVVLLLPERISMRRPAPTA
jgi:membrane associated rhomboid family serine protease